MTRVTKGNNGITKKYNALTHRGVDIGWHTKETDNIILAHSDGVVIGVVKNYTKTDKTGNSYGNYILIRHNGGYTTRNAHLKYGTIKVKVGDRVTKGQEIAVMGETGHCIGRHDHFEVIEPSGTRINPTQYINSDLPCIWNKGTYKTLKEKYVRKSPEVVETNKIKYSSLMKSVKDLCVSDEKGYAKWKKNIKLELVDFTMDTKGRIWGRRKGINTDLYICVQDSTGKQVK